MEKYDLQCPENEDAVAKKLVVIEDDKKTENCERDPTHDIVLVDNDDKSSRAAESVKENNDVTKR